MNLFKRLIFFWFGIKIFHFEIQLFFKEVSTILFINFKLKLQTFGRDLKKKKGFGNLDLLTFGDY